MSCANVGITGDRAEGRGQVPGRRLPCDLGRPSLSSHARKAGRTGMLRKYLLAETGTGAQAPPLSAARTLSGHSSGAPAPRPLHGPSPTQAQGPRLRACRSGASGWLQSQAGSLRTLGEGISSVPACRSGFHPDGKSHPAPQGSSPWKLQGPGPGLFPGQAHSPAQREDPRGSSWTLGLGHRTKPLQSRGRMGQLWALSA